jgi:hypothetical protein
MKWTSADCGWRSITDKGRALTRKRTFAHKQPVGQISKSVSSPDSKNIPLSHFAKITSIDSPVSLARGAARDRHGRGAGCGGRDSVGAQMESQGRPSSGL